MKIEDVNIGFALIGREEVASVSAREVHEFLEVKSKFTDWMNRNIQKFGFEDGADFSALRSVETHKT